MDYRNRLGENPEQDLAQFMGSIRRRSELAGQQVEREGWVARV